MFAVSVLLSVWRGSFSTQGLRRALAPSPCPGQAGRPLPLGLTSARVSCAAQHGEVAPGLASNIVNYACAASHMIINQDNISFAPNLPFIL